MQSVRVMTYNVHSCRGSDRRLSPERIARVIQKSAPDIVALQELDVKQTRSGGLDQAEYLAGVLGMRLHFVAARACHGGHYGNAILSRFPSETVRSGALPQLNDACEPRAVQWVRVEAPWGELDIFNVHLGLERGERRLQTNLLLGDEWLGHATRDPRAVVCGDLNAGPGSYVYRHLARHLQDAQRRPVRRFLGKPRPRATFPALFPLVRIDHVFLGKGLIARHSEVPSSLLSRVASDHRPLVVDLELATANRDDTAASLTSDEH